MRSTFFVALSVAASALGLSITSPADNSIYGPTSPIVLTWTSVVSDPASFEAIFIDPTQKITSVVDQSATTSAHSVTLSPPSGGWPIGNNWKINAMGNTPGQSGILAQSGSFNITANGASGATVVAPTTMSGVAAPTVTAPTVTSAGAPSDTSDVGLNPTSNSNGAVGSYQMSGMMLAVAAVMHAFVL